jgi:hypothetical protein
MPSQNDPETFSDRMDVFLSELPVVVTQANAQNSENNALNAGANSAATTATTKASEAGASALAASGSAANAAAALGGQLWVSGTTYTVGYLVYSPLNGRSYRRLIAGAGTTDPSADATTWVLLSVVVEQADIGTAPNQIPLNGFLGAMAYRDNVELPILPGAGITLGTGTICKGAYTSESTLKQVRIVVDLTGLKGGGTAGDLIGSDSTSINTIRQPCFIGQIPAGMTVFGGRMTCLETPAGGGTDLDLYSATEGTGVQDSAVGDLTETQLINAGAQAVGTVTHLAADPAASSFLYLVSQGTSTTAYTAGRFLVELFGV